MNFCESLSDKTRKRAIRDAIASALFGCIPEMTVDTGAIIVIYIALLGGNDASRMFSSSFSALTAILLTLPAAKVVDLFGTKKTVALACYTAVAMFFVMALAPFLPPAFSLPVFFIALFIYGAKIGRAHV